MPGTFILQLGPNNKSVVSCLLNLLFNIHKRSNNYRKSRPDCTQVGRLGMWLHSGGTTRDVAALRWDDSGCGCTQVGRFGMWLHSGGTTRDVPALGWDASGCRCTQVGRLGMSLHSVGTTRDVAALMWDDSGCRCTSTAGRATNVSIA